MSTQKVIFLAIVFMGSCYLSCDKTVVMPDQLPLNMYDTSSARFVPPVSTVLSPSEGQVMGSSTVTMQWGPAVPSVGAFQYAFDGGLAIWSVSRETTFTLIDEGGHTFSLRAVHLNGETLEPWRARKFTVDAVHGPAVLTKPRFHNRRVNDQFDIAIWAEEVISLMGVKVTLSFDKNYLTIVSDPQEGEFLRKNNGTTPPLTFQVDKANGKVVVELVVFGGAPRGVDGSGVLFTVRFSALKPGTTVISFLTSDIETIFRDPQNSKIRINQFVNGNVIIN